MINLNNKLRNDIFAKRKVKIVIDFLNSYEAIGDLEDLRKAEIVCYQIIKTYPCFLAAKALSVVLLKSRKLDKLKDCLKLMESTMDKNNIKQLHTYNKFKHLVNLQDVVLENILDTI